MYTLTITDPNRINLAQIQNIQTLNIQSGAINPVMCLKLREIFRYNNTVTSLYFSKSVGNNHISNLEEYEYLFPCIADILKVNCVIKSLFIGIRATERSLASLAEGLRVNCTLEKLSMFPGRGLPLLGDALKVNSGLREVRISGLNIEEDDMIQFSECLKVNRTLKSLSIEYFWINGCVLESLGNALVENDTLVDLSMSFNFGGLDHLATGLKVNKGLKRLGLNVTCTTDVVKSAAEVLAVNKCITQFNMFCPPNPVINGLGGTDSSFIFDALQGNCTLQQLGLGLFIDEKSVLNLSEFLQHNSTLTHLDLIGCSVSIAGVKAIADVLVLNTSLTHLSLMDNNLSSEEAFFLSAALKKNYSLQTLDLSMNKINDDGAEYIGECLKMNFSLTSLLFDNNNINDKGASAIASALMDNTVLTSLHFSGANLSPISIRLFSKSIASNDTLTELYLSSNGLDEICAFYLAIGLTANCGLKKLDLSNNRIIDIGGMYLVRALTRNTTLEVLDLSKNEYEIEEKIFQTFEIDFYRNIVVFE